MKDVYDCIVIGGGIVGSSTCYQLAKDGLNVLMLEQFTECNSNGSSHGDGRIIRNSYAEDVYVRLSSLSFSIWNQIQLESNSKLIQWCGGLYYGIKDSKELHEIIQTFDKNNFKYQKLCKNEAETRFPQYQFKDDDLIVYQKDAGVVYASKSVKVLWDLSKRYGAEVLENKQVLKIQYDDELNLVSVYCSDHSVYKCKKIVLSCGGWINDLLERSNLGLQLDLKLTQEKVFYWEPKSDHTTIDYSQYSNPIAIYFGQKDFFYSLPQIDIKGVKIGYHHSGVEIESMDGYKPEYKIENLNIMKEYVKHYMPGLDHSKESSSVKCHYTSTKNWNFVIDKHPNYSSIIIVSACSGHGFKFAPGVGKLISNLVQDKESPIGETSEFNINHFIK